VLWKNNAPQHDPTKSQVGAPDSWHLAIPMPFSLQTQVAPPGNAVHSTWSVCWLQTPSQAQLPSLPAEQPLVMQEMPFPVLTIDWAVEAEVLPPPAPP
jgi:hypothetical protein